MKNILILILFFAFINSCTPPLQKRFLTTEDVQYEAPTTYLVEGRSAISRVNRTGKGRDCCNDQANYIPDTTHLNHTPMRVIRINFHFTNSADSSQNLNGKAAEKYSRELFNEATNRLKNNQKMWLPKGHSNPALPLRYRYKITPRSDDPNDIGIYCHYDDNLYYYLNRGKDRNNHRREVIKKYGVQLDTVLNAFLMPPHPDSVASPTYKVNQAGISLGNAVKVSGEFKGRKFKPWECQHSLNHEIGHACGLAHTWRFNDGCEDTPKNPNCWHRKTRPECDSLASNNIMDYNCNRNSWSPCQIGRVHYNMSKENSKIRKLLLPTWCTLNENQTITIQDSVHWKSMKDLGGHLIIEPSGILQMSCRLSLPKGAKIIVRPGGKLILDNCKIHNACGDEWQGIELENLGKKIGTVVFLGEPSLENMAHPITQKLEDK